MTDAPTPPGPRTGFLTATLVMGLLVALFAAAAIMAYRWDGADTQLRLAEGLASLVFGGFAYLLRGVRSPTTRALVCFVLLGARIAFLVVTIPGRHSAWMSAFGDDSELFGLLEICASFTQSFVLLLAFGQAVREELADMRAGATRPHRRG